MELKYVPVEFDWFHETQDLDAAEKGRLMDGLMAYAMGADPEQYLTGQERLIFRHYQRKVDTLRESIAEKSETQSRNGSKGGRPRSKKPENPKKPSLNSVSEENPEKQDKDKIENEIEIEKEKEIEKEDISILNSVIDRYDSSYQTGTPEAEAEQVLAAWDALDIGPAGDAATILLQTELRDRLQAHGLPAVLAVLEEVRRSDYLMGRVTGSPAKFAWLMQTEPFCKTLAGYYRTTSPPRGPDPPKPSFDPDRAEQLRKKEASKCV